MSVQFLKRLLLTGKKRGNMKTRILLAICFCVPALWLHSQEMKFANITVSLHGGRIGIIEGDFMGRPGEELYKKVMDSVTTVLKKDPLDTTALFLSSLIKSQYFLMRPSSAEQVNALEVSATEIDSAFSIGVSNLTARVLRARIYYQLKSCFIADEGWRYESQEVRRERRAKFERYQSLSNRYHEELVLQDPPNAHDYKQRISIDSYPLKVD